MSPKTLKNQRRSANNRPNGSNITKVKFHDFIAVALTAATAQITVAPTNLGALAEMSAVFDLYRINKLRYRIHPNSGMTSFQTVAYYPETVIATTTAAPNMENPDGIVQMADTTVPTQWHNVPSARLKGQLDWWKCTADASAGDFEIQGVLVFTGTGTETVFLEVDGLAEFKNPVDAAAAMDRMRAAVLHDIQSSISK